jgi:hypothetical protein
LGKIYRDDDEATQSDVGNGGVVMKNGKFGDGTMETIPFEKKSNHNHFVQRIHQYLP